ncbi:PAS domain-containing hybrid sensor histidine kinase/response regulator [Desulforegula conservatrix]|uniref:PAS domain-containing hybrid sensor histidine kinase/response regulator n=1 Tax=Desulforegula conservatrix TaxID=153026 RepID=UPI0003FF3845|nr:PAS domain S-box protein [Desulforegula conservatrix]
MSRIPHDLFLLMLNLSQLDSEEVIKELFIEAIIDWTGNKHLGFSCNKEKHEGFFLEIATPDYSFGGINFDKNDLGDDDFFVLKNVATTLAVILDSLRNKRLIEQEKRTLEAMVQKRTEELKKINQELMSEIMDRELYEQQLIEKETRYREIVENINDVLFTMDSQGVITYISPVIRKITGYAPEYIIGNDFIRFIYPDDRLRIDNKFKNAAIEGVFITKLRVVGQNGKIRWLRASVKTITEGCHLKGFRGLLADITDIKELDDRLELIAQNIDEVLWIIDAEGTHLTYISPSYEKIWGYSSKALYENLASFIDSVHPEDQPRIRNEIKKVMETGYFDGECRIVRPDGETRWMWVKSFPLKNSNGEIINRIGLARDLTEKKQTELKYSAIIQTSLVGFLIIDIKSGILEANDAACSMTGYSSAELLGMNISSIEAKYSHEMVVEMLADVSAKGWGRFESRLRSRDGRVIDVDVSVNNLPTEKNSFVVFVRDITEKKQLEEHVIQAQRMESIGRLAAGIAHDFNNLLSPILGYTEMMMLSSQGESAQRPMLDEIKKAAERSKDLIRQLMAFSRKQVIETKNTSFPGIVDGFYKILRRTLRENIEIRTVHNSTGASIIADIGKIEQIIMNLAVNAQDSMPEGGTLVIETGSVFLDDAEAAMISGLVPGRYATLSVSDSGFGMDAETQKKIFEPFYTTKEEGSGTGLGLATVYGISSQHDGGVAVHSEPGKGSVFVVYIPQRKNFLPEGESEHGDQVVLSGAEDGATVLVAEDEEITRKVVLNILTSLGYNAICASSGEECLFMMEDSCFAGKVRLLLSDVIMPDMKGPDLFKKIREKHPEMKAVFMSGYPEESMKIHGFRMDDYEFIQKPFSVKDLASKVRSILNKNRDD